MGLDDNGHRAAVGRVANGIRDQVQQHALYLFRRHAHRDGKTSRSRLEADPTLLRLGAKRA
jgi:hypothetical protein